MIEITYNTYSVMDILTICSLLLNLVLSLPVGLNKIKFIIRKKTLKRLLGNDVITIHIPSRKIENRIKPVVAVEDYNTFENIKDILLENKFEVNLKYIPSTGGIELEPDTGNIVICGPKNSYMVEDVFRNLGTLLFIEEDGKWHFIDEENAKILSPMDCEPKRNEDIAFLGNVKLNSQLNDKVLLICGIHAIGSLGIANLLKDKTLLDELLKNVQGKEFYSLIHSAYSEDEKKIYRTKIYKPAKIITRE